MAADVAAQAARSSPAIAVAAPTLMGVDLNSFVLILTIIYVALQIGFLLHKWVRLSRTAPAAHDSDE